MEVQTNVKTVVSTAVESIQLTLTLDEVEEIIAGAGATQDCRLYELYSKLADARDELAAEGLI